MSPPTKIYIAGHTGLVGSALVRWFMQRDAVNLIVAPRGEVDLTNQQVVESYLKHKKPDVVIIAAGRVGGIQANSRYPAEFLYDNLMIAANVIHAAWKAGVQRLLNLGSSCIYPKCCSQPMTPDQLMTGHLESTNEPYAMAKLAGMSLCTAYNAQYGTSYINVIPSNLYGPGDSFDSRRSHVIASLIAKFHDAKTTLCPSVTLWGTGAVKRDFLFIDDFAAACGFLLQHYERPEPINVGALAPCTIRELSVLVAKIVGYAGDIHWDATQPNGAPERILGTAVLSSLGWNATTDLEAGLEKTYRWYKETLCASS